MSVIITASKKNDRSIETPMPALLTVDTLAQVQEILGDDFEKIALKFIQDQATIKLRAKVRGMLEATEKPDGSDVEQLKNTDAAILASEDWPNWKPSLREPADPQQKLADLVGQVGIDGLVKILAQQQGKTEDEVRAALEM